MHSLCKLCGHVGRADCSKTVYLRPQGSCAGEGDGKSLRAPEPLQVLHNSQSVFLVMEHRMGENANKREICMRNNLKGFASRFGQSRKYLRSVDR